MSDLSELSQDLLRVGLIAASEAAAVLRREQNAARRGVRTKTGSFDLVTTSDEAAESAIRDVLRRQRPHDAVLGEEAGESAGGGRVRWVVDPLDGTINYVSGLPAWAVSVAAEVDGVAVAGVVLAPALRREYAALRGQGARLNGKRLTVRPTTIGDAVLATGFAADPDRRSRQLVQLGALLPHVRDVRCHGAASLELCAVAAGEIDVYVESDLKAWDIAAGALIATEAGATVIGSPDGPDPLIAAHRSLAATVRRQLAEARR